MTRQVSTSFAGYVDGISGVQIGSGRNAFYADIFFGQRLSKRRVNEVIAPFVDELIEQVRTAFLRRDRRQVDDGSALLEMFHRSFRRKNIEKMFVRNVRSSCSCVVSRSNPADFARRHC